MQTAQFIRIQGIKLINTTQGRTEKPNLTKRLKIRKPTTLSLQQLQQIRREATQIHIQPTKLTEPRMQI